MTRVFRSVVPIVGAKPRGPHQTRIPFRARDAFFEPGAAGKILVAGAVEGIDRTAGRPKSRRKGARYLDTRSGHLRLAVIADSRS
jgi:hypothetical protein